MATITSSATQRRFSAEKGAHRERGEKLEYRIRKLDRICRNLEEKPVLNAGVSSQELLEILKAEQRRLKESRAN